VDFRHFTSVYIFNLTRLVSQDRQFSVIFSSSGIPRDTGMLTTAHIISHKARHFEGHLRIAANMGRTTIDPFWVTAHMVLPQINYYRLSFWKHNDMGMRQNLYITIHQHFLEEWTSIDARNPSHFGLEGGFKSTDILGSLEGYLRR